MAWANAVYFGGGYVINERCNSCVASMISMLFPPVSFPYTRAPHLLLVTTPCYQRTYHKRTNERKAQSNSSGGGSHSSSMTSPFGGRFQAFGASLRQSAQDVAAKAAAQVHEINSKVGAATPTVHSHNNQAETSPITAHPSTPTTTTAGGSDGAASAMASSPPPTPQENTAGFPPAKLKEYQELLQKMSRKLKAQAAINQQLTLQVESIEAEKKRLESLVTDEILNGVVVKPGDDLVPQLQAAWRQHDEQHSLALQQLQKEFQSVQQQQNGDAAEDGMWELERKKLLQKHEEELAKLKDELSNRPPQPPPTGSNTTEDGNTSHLEEIERIKEAAAAQLQAFKKKVATARNAELQKVKAEAAAAAKKVMELKLTEQKEKYQQQLAEVIQQYQQQNSDESSSAVLVQIERLKQDFAAEQKQIQTAANGELERVRQENEQDDQQQTVAVLENELQELRQKYDVAMQQLAKQPPKAAESSHALEQELQQVKERLGSTIDSLRAQLDVATQGNKNNNDLVEQKEAEIARLREEMAAAQETQQKQWMEQLAKDKESVRLDFQQKWKEASAKNQAAAANQLQEALQAATTDFTAKLEQLRNEMESQTTEKVNQTRAELEASKHQAVQMAEAEANARLQSAQNKLDTELRILKEQLQERDSGLQTAQNQAQSLQVELAELKSRLESFRDGDSANPDESLVVQQENEMIEAMKNQVETLVQARDEAMSKMNAVQEELYRMKEAADSELAMLKQQVADAAKDRDDAIATLNASHDAALADLSKRLKEMESANTEALDAKLEIEALNWAITEMKASHENELAELRTATVSGHEVENNASKNELLMSMQKKLEEVENARQTTESTLAEVQNELIAAKEKLEHVDSFSSEDLQKEFDAKLKALDEAQANVLKKVQDEHVLVLNKIGEEAHANNAASLARLEQENAELRMQIEVSKKSFDDEKSSMRKSMETHVDKMTAQFKEKLEAVRTAASEEVSTLQKEGQEKDSKLKQLVDRLKALTATSTKLRDDNAALKLKLESEATAHKEFRSQLEVAKKQLDETVANSSTTVSSLLQRQESLEKEKSNFDNICKKMQAELLSKSNKVEELSGKLQALSDNLNALTKDQKEKDDKLEQASKQEAKLKASETEVTDLRGQINKLKLEMTKNATLVEKLQGEKEANERNQGQRNALLGMLETHLSEMKDKNEDINAKLEAAIYDLSQKDDLIQADAERIQKLERDLDEAKTMAKRTSESLVAAQKGADSKSGKLVESLQKELQATKQQMARKSTAAQRLLQQRESECAELRKTNKALQQEVDKGSYSDRRIFELAAKQSNRESYQVSEIEVRDSIIERLKEALLDRDGDLASAEKHAHEVESQIEELFRIRRREDVNIDYLKSIVVQYLSLPPGSTERAGLLPVLATLLQFDDIDYRTIEEGKNKVSWWNGSVVPKLINAPSSSGAVRLAPTGSAEVSVSTSSASATGRKTSLQF